MIILLCLISLIKCNLWDNIVTNSNSPLIELGEEYKVELYDNNNKTLSIDNKVIDAYFSIANNTIVLRIYRNIFNSIKRKGSSEDSDAKQNSIYDEIIIDFNKGFVSAYNLDKAICTVYTASSLEYLSVKLLLVSYDIYTYYNQTESFDQYIITDPYQLTANTTEERLERIDDPIFRLHQRALTIFNVANNTLHDIIVKYNGQVIGNYLPIIYTKYDHDELISLTQMNYYDKNLCDYENQKVFPKITMADVRRFILQKIIG